MVGLHGGQAATCFQQRRSTGDGQQSAGVVNSVGPLIPLPSDPPPTPNKLKDFFFLGCSSASVAKFHVLCFANRATAESNCRVQRHRETKGDE